MYIFLHIQRCAGTWLIRNGDLFRDRWFAKVSADHTLSNVADIRKRVEDIQQNSQAKVFLHGHTLYYGIHEFIGASDPKYFAIVRGTEDRLISYYRYFYERYHGKGRSWHLPENLGTGGPFDQQEYEDYLRKCFSEPRINYDSTGFLNPMTRSFSSYQSHLIYEFNDSDLQRAKSNSSRIKIIYIDKLQELSEFLGYDLPINQPINQAKYDMYPSDGFMNELISINRYDKELYSYLRNESNSSDLRQS